MSWRSVLSLALCVLALSYSSATGDFPEDNQRDGPPVQGDYIRPGVSAADILRGRGYLAKEFYFYTKDGYKINIVRGRNPLINGGKSALAGTLPILFVHGTVDAAPTLLSSAGSGVRPRNFSKKLRTLHKVQSSENLIELLEGDPSTINTPFLALNFGYEVWLVNRRGFNKSKGRRGHENRTLTEAIASIPGTFLANGHHPDWIKKERPHAEADEQLASGEGQTSTTPKQRERETHSALTFWKQLFTDHLSLKNLPKALTNFGKFQEQFIQTFDPEFWDFSLDEQAEHDIPDAIEFVVEKTGCSKVHTVGISSGAALILLAAADRPELASKMASAILWAPALNMGSAKDIVYEIGNFLPISQSYSGPVPFVFSQQQLAGMMQELCKTDYMQRNLCSRLIDVFFGFSDIQSPVKPAMLANLLEPTSYHELAHLGQFARSPQPCKFKFNDPKKNVERYGREEPPCYDLGRVGVEFISIYAGNEDLLISPGDINTTCSQLSVPFKLTMIDQTGIYFNHGGAVIHERCDSLVQTPSFLDIWRAESAHKLAKVAANCHVRRRQGGKKSRPVKKTAKEGELVDSFE